MDGEAAKGLNERRRMVRSLLSQSEPGDALASYYALWHDARRTNLTVHYDPSGRVDGFLTVSQTGADLFRQLVTLRAPDAEAVRELLQNSLAPHRPYSFIAPVRLASCLRDLLEISRASMECIYRLDLSLYQPIVNVLVQRVVGPDSTLRYQIESSGEVVALSGTNWRSPTFAELFVYVHPKGRARSWGQSVVSACAADLLTERLHPLYTVREDNAASVRLAQAVGFVDTGCRQFACEGLLQGAGTEKTAERGVTDEADT